MSELMCNRYGVSFLAGDCPDHGTMDCPRAVPGAKCRVDEELVSELLEAKLKYYRRKARTVSE